VPKLIDRAVAHADTKIEMKLNNNYLMKTKPKIPQLCFMQILGNMTSWQGGKRHHQNGCSRQ
jgi:hypothetical protein